MIEWSWPWFFVLTPLPWLVYRYAKPVAHRQAALRVPFFHNWVSLQQDSNASVASASLLSLLGLWFIWLALLTACARPLWIGEAIEIPRSGRDLMLAVDISGSMELADMVVNNQAITRLDTVKAVASAFIEEREGDRLGLVLFGSKAYVQSPLSFDVATVTRFLNESQIGFAGEKTAIGDAIGLAVKRLQQQDIDSRVLILLTDGQDTASSITPLEAARLAEQTGIRIYTIGVGADSMTQPGLFGSSFGGRRFNPSADLDEKTLSEIANLTGGRYFRARSPQELAQIYQLLDQLEPVEKDAAQYRPQKSLSFWPILAALIASLLLALANSDMTFGSPRESKQ